MTYNNNPVPFSTRLMVARIARQLTQAELSKRSGIEKSLLSRYENGYAPTEENVKKIESTLGISLDHPKIVEAARHLHELPENLAPIAA